MTQAGEEPPPFAAPTSLTRRRKSRGGVPPIVYVLAILVFLAGGYAFLKLSEKGGPLEQRQEGRPSLSEARECMRNEAYDCAEADYKAYLKLYPNDALTNARLAMVLTRDGRHTEALPYYKKARDLGIDYYDVDAGYAESLDATGDIDGAIELNRESLKIVPTLVDVREHLADELVRKGKPQEAVDLLEDGDRQFADNGYGPYFTEKIAQIKARMGQASSEPAASSAEAAPGVTEVPLVSEHGTLAVPVTIDNAVSAGFVVDSGASEVTIPAGMARTLIEKGQLRAADYRGYITANLADGSQVREQLFIIHSLKVGDRELTNVMGEIGGERGSLLLGQSFLRRFKSWSIDNRRRVLVLTN